MKKMTLSEAEIEQNIKEILNLSYLPLTGADIRDYLYEKVGRDQLNEHTFKSVLKRIADNGIIKRDRITGRKYVFYSTADRSESEGIIEIYILGKKISFSTHIDTSQNSNEEDIIIEEQMLQCIGFIDFYEIRKFCGIHQYTPGKVEKGRVQRAMKVDWVGELRELLKAANTTMMTSAIVYLDENDPIELEEISTLGEYKLYKLKIPYGGTSFDDDKIGWILDGQQRMWATELIAISKGIKEGEEVVPIIAPISIAIGNFPDNEEQLKKKMDIIRKIFIVSNETRPIPEIWRKSLISHMDSKNIAAISKKLSKYSTYERISRRLNNDDDSPFKGKIDVTDLSKKRSDTPLITLGNMTETVKYITELRTSLLTKGFLAEDSEDFKTNLARIKDYFNSIKAVWEDSWKKDYLKNKIRSPVILFAFAFLTQEFASISIRRKPRQELIKDHFIPMLLVVKSYTDFDSDDPTIIGLSYSKKQATELWNDIRQFCLDFMEEIDDSDIQSLYAKVLSYYSSESPNHF